MVWLHTHFLHPISKPILFLSHAIHQKNETTFITLLPQIFFMEKHGALQSAIHYDYRSRIILKKSNYLCVFVLKVFSLLDSEQGSWSRPEIEKV